MNVKLKVLKCIMLFTLILLTSCYVISLNSFCDKNDEIAVPNELKGKWEAGDSSLWIFQDNKICNRKKENINVNIDEYNARYFIVQDILFADITISDTFRAEHSKMSELALVYPIHYLLKFNKIDNDKLEIFGLNYDSIKLKIKNDEINISHFVDDQGRIIFTATSKEWKEKISIMLKDPNYWADIITLTRIK